MAKERIVEVETIIPSGVLKLADNSGGTLELVEWANEPAVIVDGCFILRRSTLVRELVSAKSRFRQKEGAEK